MVPSHTVEVILPLVDYAHGLRCLQAIDGGGLGGRRGCRHFVSGWWGDVVVVRRTALMLAALLVAALATVVVAGPAAADSRCTSLHMIGLRGSGEPSYKSENDLGGTVFDMYNQLVQRANYEGVPMTVDGVGQDEGYPASAVLDPWRRDGNLEGTIAAMTDSAGKGTLALAARLDASPPDSCIVLAGYSQGAWAIGDLFRAAYAARLLRTHRIAAVVLFGDPRLDPTAPPAVLIGQAEGTGLLRRMGLPVGDSYFPDATTAHTQSYCLAHDPICDATPNPADGLLHNLNRHFGYTSEKALRSDWVTQDGAIYAAEVAFPLVKGSTGEAPVPFVASTATHSEGVMVYLTLRFDQNGGAVGFGFRGVNGSGWAPESHPFTDPSYGRITQGQVEYPFNHGCGTAQTVESDVEAWLYDAAGRTSPPVTIHLACG
jgi:hypothetical protein